MGHCPLQVSKQFTLSICSNPYLLKVITAKGEARCYLKYLSASKIIVEPFDQLWACLTFTHLELLNFCLFSKANYSKSSTVTHLSAFWECFEKKLRSFSSRLNIILVQFLTNF